ITTALVPIGMNELRGVAADYQIADHPDGGFYGNYRGQIQQLKSRIINSTTAEIVDDPRKIEDLKLLLWPEFRMILCLDDFYKTYRVINDQSIFVYEQYLKDRFQETVVVRMASNCINEKAIGIRFQPESNLFSYLKLNCKIDGLQARFTDSIDPEDGGK